MNLLEKIGDLLVDLAKYTFGGVVLGAIMVNREGTDVTFLYIVGTIVTAAFVGAGFLFYWLQKKI
ncbi:MAG: hypothetical protein LBS94_05405 [Prevotellaceae bacterium]|nr:hypothetical protein [Prevotellaceae bacterium]